MDREGEIVRGRKREREEDKEIGNEKEREGGIEEWETARHSERSSGIKERETEQLKERKGEV